MCLHENDHLDSKYKDQLYELIRLQLKQLPPYVTMSDDEITQILKQPDHFLNLRYKSDEAINDQIYLYVARDDEIVCATQIAVKGDSAFFYWIACKPKFHSQLPSFFQKLKHEISKHGLYTIGSIRNSFGIGWEGIPDCWEEILQGLLAAGFNIDDRWQSYYWIHDWIDVKDNLPAVSIKVNNEQNRTIEFLLYKEDKQIGDAEVWLPSPISKSLNEFGFAELEYIEVYKKYRGQKYGKSFLVAIQKALKETRIEGFMLWTELDNIAMQKLAESIGFAKGPVFHWLQLKYDE